MALAIGRMHRVSSGPTTISKEAQDLEQLVCQAFARRDACQALVNGLYRLQKYNPRFVRDVLDQINSDSFVKINRSGNMVPCANGRFDSSGKLTHVEFIQQSMFGYSGAPPKLVYEVPTGTLRAFCIRWAA